MFCSGRLFGVRRCSIHKAMSWFLAGLITLGTPVMASGPVEIRAKDVTLADQGVLTGAVLNTSAQAVDGVQVHVLHGEKVVASAMSDDDGKFSVSGLRNGLHIIQVGSTQQPVRFWGAEAAPPASATQMSIVVDEEIVRGQQCNSSCGEAEDTLNMGALLIFGGALAVVLITTLDDDDDALPASP